MKSMQLLLCGLHPNLWPSLVKEQSYAVIRSGLYFKHSQTTTIWINLSLNSLIYLTHASILSVYTNIYFSLKKICNEISIAKKKNQGKMQCCIDYIFSLYTFRHNRKREIREVTSNFRFNLCTEYKNTILKSIQVEAHNLWLSKFAAYLELLKILFITNPADDLPFYISNTYSAFY